jgi:rhodanese-related sulfurtransferase
MKTYIIDVREPEEYAISHVKGAVNIPPFTLMNNPQELNNIPKDAKIILYCHTGSRSNVAMHFLRSLGYSNLINGINQGQVEARYLQL